MQAWRTVAVMRCLGNKYVAVAAYHIAELRGFTSGDPRDDWLAAEAEVDRLIASGHVFE